MYKYKRLGLKYKTIAKESETGYFVSGKKLKVPVIADLGGLTLI
jgi:hypothetical protein